jgi:uncharacterized protein DUF6912
VSVRVYVPTTVHGLAAAVAAGGLGPAPFLAHAVTDALRAALPGAGEEDWEYAAASAAGQSSVGMLDADEPARRVVLAVDVPAARPAGEPDDPTVVQVDEVVPLRRVAAVLADSQDAEATVSAARDAGGHGAAEASRALEKCLDHELGWWAAQEIPVLLEETGSRDLGAAGDV